MQGQKRFLNKALKSEPVRNPDKFVNMVKNSFIERYGCFFRGIAWQKTSPLLIKADAKIAPDTFTESKSMLILRTDI